VSIAPLGGMRRSCVAAAMETESALTPSYVVSENGVNEPLSEWQPAHLVSTIGATSA